MRSEIDFDGFNPVLAICYFFCQLSRYKIIFISEINIISVKLIIKRSIESDGNIKPEVYNLLNNLPEEVLHHKSYGLLHPLGIYNRSLSRITDAFSDVLTEIKRFKKDIGPIGVHSKEHVSFESLNLLKAQKELLYSFQSHIDDCYHILKEII